MAPPGLDRDSQKSTNVKNRDEYYFDYRVRGLAPPGSRPEIKQTKHLKNRDEYLIKDASQPLNDQGAQWG